MIDMVVVIGAVAIEQMAHYSNRFQDPYRRQTGITNLEVTDAGPLVFRSVCFPERIDKR